MNVILIFIIVCLSFDRLVYMSIKVGGNDSVMGLYQ